MAYSITGHLGIDLTETVAGTGTSSDQGNEFPLGHRVCDNNGVEYMYVHASGAITQYDFLGIDENGEATSVVDAGAEAHHTVGVAQVAFADNDFGWVAIDAPMGNINGRVAASCAADTETLFNTATAGVIDDASTAGATPLRGVVLVTAAATNATNREILMRAARFAE